MEALTDRNCRVHSLNDDVTPWERIASFMVFFHRESDPERGSYIPTCSRSSAQIVGTDRALIDRGHLFGRSRATSSFLVTARIRMRLRKARVSLYEIYGVTRNSANGHGKYEGIGFYDRGIDTGSICHCRCEIRKKIRSLLSQCRWKEIYRFPTL